MKTYRLLEIFPGALSWLTFGLLIFFSWYAPIWVAVFIIVFDIYWFLKTVFLSLHLRFTFKKMTQNMKVNWLQKSRELKGWGDIYHLVILPMSREPHEVVRDTFLSLSRINYPKERLIVVLGVEGRCGERAASVAKKIEEEFGKEFFKFLATVHPDNLEGEIAGKGSNETWAAKEAKRLIIDPRNLAYEKILTSVFDVDTQIMPDYFGCLTHAYLTSPNAHRASYQPIPLFLNNIYQAPAIARVIAFSASFWHMMQQARPERLTTFSSHSMPFKALVEIGFWDTSVVSEDSRIFWQCFLRYNGDWRVHPLFYPVSMDANVSCTFWGTLLNQYKQQRRWGYGAENIPYVLGGFLGNKSIPKRVKWRWGFNIVESFHSWATTALIIFILGWLPIIVGRGGFHHTLLSYNLPKITGFIMNLASVGIVSSAYLSIVLLPYGPFSNRVGYARYAIYVLQWVLMPVTLILFGAIPAMDAQTRLMLGGRFRLGFWITPKHRP